MYDTGCPVLAPPMQGALVCLRTVDTMYCSVYCDNLFEFASTPLNPYYCGACSNFRWTDYVTKQTYTELPRCTGKEMLVARLAVKGHYVNLSTRHQIQEHTPFPIEQLPACPVLWSEQFYHAGYHVSFPILPSSEELRQLSTAKCFSGLSKCCW